MKNRKDYNFVSHYEIMKDKFERMSKIAGIQNKGQGLINYIGKVAPGCVGCLTRGGYGYGSTTKLGNKCNLNCPYCFDGDCKDEVPVDLLKDKMTKIYRKSLDSNVRFKGFAFSNGEPTLYMGRMSKFAKLFKQIEEDKGIKLWNKLYTNGTLLDEEKLELLMDWNIKELRFHISASNFSDKVFRNMEKATEMGFVVCVEEAVYITEKFKKGIMEHLKTFEEVGLKHMQMCEVKVYDFSIDNIVKDLPDARFYTTNQDFMYHEGFTYDVMEKVLEKDYNFSVLDCSSEIWRINHGVQGNIEYEDIEDLFAYYGDETRLYLNEWEKIE